MNGQRGQLRTLIARGLVSVVATVLAFGLLAPTAVASPIGDAEAAIMAAWDKAGGDTSPLGARKGDVYPVADGFALDFDSGKMFYTSATGAKLLYGPILDKYEMLGGPAGSDLGFPTINEVPGLEGPDSRVATFSATDKPVIFWTPEHGAFVVRGPLNAAWDKLGSSGGVLGVPVGDETYNGGVSTQKFSGGQVSWNRQTKEFTSEPAALADQLKGLQVAVDPTAAINMAWRAAGGAGGPLGAKQGNAHPIGGDGIVQDFAGGKVYFSPATGANALESDIAAKYESLGGPVSSDLGFPTANEADGGVGASSRIATFAGADKPVIFWTSDHGAFVVRGAMKAAWDKLRGPAGKLGAPVGDQAADRDVVSQKFTGGKISWNRAKNTFATEPSNLAPLLTGVQVPGQNQPSVSPTTPHAKNFAWHWWYLLGVVPVLLLIGLFVLLASVRRRRRRRQDVAAYAPEHDDGPPLAAGYDGPADGHWGPREPDDVSTEHFASGDAGPAPDAGQRVSWRRGAGTTTGLAEDTTDVEAYADPRAESDTDSDHFEGHAEPHAQPHSEPHVQPHFEAEDDDPDATDTTPTPVISQAVLAEAGYDETGYDETGYDETGYAETGYDEARYAEGAYPDAEASEYVAHDAGHPNIVAQDATYAEVVEDDGEYRDVAVPHSAPDGGRPYAAADFEGGEAPEESGYAEPEHSGGGYSDAGYPDVAIPHAAPDVGYAEVDEYDADESDTAFTEAFATQSEPTSGRHAAVDPADVEAVSAGGPAPTPTARPTLHLPMDDPYQAPDGYPIKASARFGLYYTPQSALYHDTLAEIWFATEEVAQANGFVKAD